MKRAAALCLLVSALLLIGAPAASAHPLGNFTVNRYAGIHLSPGEVEVDYVLDLAEIPTFQEAPRIDADGDGIMATDELQSWASRSAPGIAEGLRLAIDGTPVELAANTASSEVFEGQGGLQILRLEATFSGTFDSRVGIVTFEDWNEPDRIGWRELSALGEDGVALRDSTVPTSSVSQRLQRYPQDMLSSPLAVSSMSASFEPASSATIPQRPRSTGAIASNRPLADAGPFAAVLENQGVPLALVGLVVAVAFGAWHALLPGHGKTLMAAAMVGSDARRRQLVTAGVAVALMHTVSVVLLGLLVLVLERTFRPELLYPWLGVAAGLAALAVGAHLVRVRMAAWREARIVDSGHGPDHHHASDHEHRHGFPSEGILSRRGMATLAFAGGILPAPSALLVMLAAIQAQRAAYGLGLVLAFSLGLAAALVVVGLGAMRIRDVASRRLSVAGHVVPVLSAVAIVAVGLFLTVRAATTI